MTDHSAVPSMTVPSMTAAHPATGTLPATDARSAVTAQLRAAGCVFAEDEARLLLAAAQSPADLADLVDRRTAGEPLEQILGWAEFCGLRIAVQPGVFVPRRRTEFLVFRAAGLRGPGSVVVDLCCGTGAVGAALLAGAPVELYPMDLYAVDLDPAAVQCARRNLAGTGARVYQGDLFRPLPARLRGRVDLIVANAPYVPSAEIALLPPEARDHEPRTALDGGPDGLALHRRLAAQAPTWLARGGHLAVETSVRQAPWTVEALSRNGFRCNVERSEERDATVVIASRG